MIQYFPPKKTSPKVSVILITYNHEKYIEQALRSILEQRVDFQMEVLIGDDASTDGTSDIIRRYAEQYPDVIHADIREENVGATKNAYLLLKKAQGEYLASLEGDDYWIDPYKLKKQISFLDTHPQVIGCTHKVACIDENGNSIKKTPEWLLQKRMFTLRDFKGIRLPGQASSLVRRNIFHSAKRDYSILMTADSMVSDRTAALIFLLQGDFYCMNEKMGVYRYHISPCGDNLTSRLFSTDLRLWKDYLLTCEMEQYAKREFDITIQFGGFKRELFAKASFRFLFRKSKEARQIAQKIFLDRAVGWKGFFSLPWQCFKILLRRSRR